jgi:hypothetical protein
MKIYRFLWLLLLAVSSFAQTHTEVTVEDPQTITGAKAACKLNGDFYVDGTCYALTDVGINAAITAAAAQGGGRVIITKPVSIAANVNLASHVIIECTGWDLAPWTWTGGVGPNAMIFGNGISDTGVRGCNLVGPNATNSTISFQTAASAQTGANATTLAVTVTVPVNATALVFVIEGSDAVTNVTDAGGSVYNRLTSVKSGNVTQTVYGTAPNKSASAATVTVNTSVSEQIAALVMVYNGVSGYGIMPLTTASSANPSELTPTQDKNNAIVTAYGWFNTAAITASAQTGTVRSNIAATATKPGIVGVDTITSGNPQNVTNSVTLSGSSPWSGVSVELTTPSVVTTSDIRGIEIDGTTRHFEEYNKISGMSYGILEQSGGTDGYVHANWVSQTFHSGIVTFDNHVSVVDNRLKYIGATNLDHALYGSGGAHSLFSGNDISNVAGFCGNIFTSSDGQNNENVRITHNTCDFGGMGSSGARGGFQIGFGGTSEYSRGVVFTGNTMSHIFGDRGLGVGDGRDFTISDNIIRYYAGDGIFATSNIAAASGGGIFGLNFSNNTIEFGANGAGQGYDLLGANGGISDLTISGGSIVSPWAGAITLSASTAAIKDGSITGVRIRDYNVAAAFANGITLSGASIVSGITVTGNRITNSTANGFAFQTDASATDNVVTGNDFIGSAGAISDSGVRTVVGCNKINSTDKNCNVGTGLAINGSTSGTVVVAVPAAAGANTATLPANTGTVGELNLAQTWTAEQTIATDLKITEQTAPSAAASNAVVYADSTSHTLKAAYNNGSFFNIPQTIGIGNVTTAGTAVTNGTCQAQTNITVTGTAVTDGVTANIGATLPATWQTGIVLSAHPTATNTVTVYLCNPTAGSITPAATQVNVRVIR